MSDVHHSFVVPAYGESEHLENCLASLAAQDVETERLVSTSTPFEGIEHLCDRYGAKLVVHGPNRGIGHDWNMALEAATSDWVTLAHQDDVYAPAYSAVVRAHGARFPDDLLVVTDYYEIVDGRRRPTVPMLRVKRSLLEIGFLGRGRVSTRGGKRRLLRFGNPIPCPSVAINLGRMSGYAFRSDLKVNLDWHAWLDVADRDGGIGYVRRPLLGHRIHEGTETSAAIVGGQRYREDLEVFETMWPRSVAKVLAGLYTRSYRSNEV